MTELKAPKGKFRVVGVDTFDHTDWVVGDYDEEGKAFEIAEKRSGTMLKIYIMMKENI